MLILTIQRQFRLLGNLDTACALPIKIQVFCFQSVLSIGNSQHALGCRIGLW